MLLCITKRKITTNLKIKNNQNCQKDQTTWNFNNQQVKETFIQTGRGMEKGSQDREDAAMQQTMQATQELVDQATHIHAQISHYEH